MCGSGSYDGYRDGEAGFDGDDKRMELDQMRLSKRWRARRRCGHGTFPSGRGGGYHSIVYR